MSVDPGEVHEPTGGDLKPDVTEGRFEARFDGMPNEFLGGNFEFIAGNPSKWGNPENWEPGRGASKEA